MPQTTSKAIDRAWADQFTTLISQPKQPDGPGWKTQEEIKAHFGIGRERAYNLIAKLLKEGKLERFCGHQKRGKRLYSKVWYRPITLKGLNNAF